MKKVVVVFIVLAVFAQAVFGQNGKVVSFRGSVELKVPNGSFENLKLGDEFPLQSVISTGIDGYAQLDIGTAVLSISPLTRLTIEDIASQPDKIVTRLNLQSGLVKAKVHKTKGKLTDFTIKSSESTASVRGTDFSFDGQNLVCEEGLVWFFNGAGQRIEIAAGQSGELRGSKLVDAKSTQTLSSAVSAETSSTYTGSIDVANPLDSLASAISSGLESTQQEEESFGVVIDIIYN